MDRVGFSFTFGDEKINLMWDSQFVGYGYLMDGLYKLSCIFYNVSSPLTFENIVAKRAKTKGKYFLLWYKHLSHISREQIEKVIKDDILTSIDFEDLDIFVDCIRGKFTRIVKKS